MLAAAAAAAVAAVAAAAAEAAGLLRKLHTHAAAGASAFHSLFACFHGWLPQSHAKEHLWLRVPSCRHRALLEKVGLSGLFRLRLKLVVLNCCLAKVDHDVFADKTSLHPLASRDKILTTILANWSLKLCSLI